VIRRRILCAALAVSVLFTPACPTTTRIITEPEGAEVTIDGLYIGKSPETLFLSRSGFPDQSYITIECAGYETIKNGIIKKSYRADLSLLLLLAGIVPYFFSARYEDDYRFALRPKAGTVVPPTENGEQGRQPMDGNTSQAPATGQ
jgi:hypothetical protein